MACSRIGAVFPTVSPAVVRSGMCHADRVVVPSRAFCSCHEPVGSDGSKGLRLLACSQLLPLPQHKHVHGQRMAVGQSLDCPASASLGTCGRMPNSIHGWGTIVNPCAGLAQPLYYTRPPWVHNLQAVPSVRVHKKEKTGVPYTAWLRVLARAARSPG